MRSVREWNPFSSAFAMSRNDHIEPIEVTSFLSGSESQDKRRDAVRRILEADLAEDGAILVCESGKPYQPDPDLAPHLLPIKEQKYGVAYIHIFRYVKEA